MSEAARQRLLFVNGRVVTLDPDRPAAEAVCVEGETITFVGSRRAARETAGAGATPFDLAGRILRPAYHDAHTHLAAASAELAQLDLRDAPSADRALARVAAAAEAAPPGSWVRGFGWDDSPGLEPPLTLERLDAVAPGRPVLLGRADGHAVLANSAALAALGYPQGHRRGVLLEAEAERARAAAPPPTPAERLAAIESALARAASLGIARLEDVIEPGALESYEDLRARGRLLCRVGAWIPLETADQEGEALRRRFPPGDPWIEVATRKAYLDGTLGARTAALGAPYADAPASAGALMYERADLTARALAADATGWALAFHAVGDAAVGLALDVLDALPPRPRPRVHRVEHAQLVARKDLPRFARLGTAASLQPAHRLRDAPFSAERVGTRREVVSYPVSSLARAGALVAFGSDWPVGPLDPRESFGSALSRDDGEGIPVEAALRAATRGPARVAGRPPAWGRITAGAPADLVVLDPGDERVLATFVAGRTTFRAPGI